MKRAAAWLLVAAAAVALAIRVPSALRTFDREAAYGEAQKAYGGALAPADATLIPDEFVLNALQYLPSGARYAFLRSATLQIARRDYHIAPVTYHALPGYMLEVLLPRLPVATAGPGQYVICYACDTSPYEGRTHWFWGDQYGRKIGLVER